jgi:uncharacterized protein (TIGR01777 family)
VSRDIVVQRRTPVGALPAALWAWHAAPGAFERLAPPWERAEVVARTHAALVEGSEVTLRVRKGPVALSWVARHRDVVPGTGFVDEQVRGPFARWHHEHQFLPHVVGSELVDTITLAAPLGMLGWIAHPFLRRTVERMLRYRHAITRHDLEQQMQTPLAPMRIAITGATGMVGRALTPMLTAEGHTVVPVSRRPIDGGIQWDPTGPLDPAKWEGLDAVIHLAGENIADGRWTDARKHLLRESRVGPTRRLAETLARLATPPRVLISASAVGIYGDTGDTVATEATPPASDFLGELGAAWEAAAAPAREAGIRVVHPRFGIILSSEGGALAKLLPTARLGLGGPLGGGSQWMSWIALDDVLGGLRHLLADASLHGPVNLVAPTAVRNVEFAGTLGAVLHRPAVLPVPALALRALFGEMADATLLASSRVAPTALEASGYQFRFPELEGALRHLLGQ